MKPTNKDLKWWFNRQINFHENDSYGNPDCVPYYEAILALIDKYGDEAEPRKVTREQVEQQYEGRPLLRDVAFGILADLGIEVEEVKK